jgi:hypothetical protein
MEFDITAFGNMFDAFDLESPTEQSIFIESCETETIPPTKIGKTEYRPIILTLITPYPVQNQT